MRVQVSPSAKFLCTARHRAQRAAALWRHCGGHMESKRSRPPAGFEAAGRRQPGQHVCAALCVFVALRLQLLGRDANVQHLQQSRAQQRVMPLLGALQRAPCNSRAHAAQPAGAC